MGFAIFALISREILFARDVKSGLLRFTIGDRSEILKVWLYFRVQYTMAPKIVRCHYPYYTVMPLSHRFFVHVLFPLNLQGNPFTVISLPLLKLIVCARRYSHRRISLSKDVGRDLRGVHQQLQSDSGTYMY